MTLSAAMLAAALSRAEIIERFKAPALVNTGGLVEVIADCPRDMRDEFQGPVATRAGALCSRLYAYAGEKKRNYPSPLIIIVVGDSRENDSSVSARECLGADGSPATRIRIPAPASADLGTLDAEIAKAFFRIVKGKTIDDETARLAVVESDPEARIIAAYADLAAWRGGAAVRGGDERMLKVARSVLRPGRAAPEDVLHFASRLFLYPPGYDLPFRGGMTHCGFRDAARLARNDPLLRLAAFAKASQIVLFGGGRGETLASAADAYSKFLFALASGKKSEGELLEMLEEADLKLNMAMEEAYKERLQ